MWGISWTTAKQDNSRNLHRHTRSMGMISAEIILGQHRVEIQIEQPKMTKGAISKVQTWHVL